MFINKTASGANNICGRNVYRFRKDLGISQRELADRLQIQGLDVDKNAIQRIEAGKRFVTDIELLSLAAVFARSVDALLEIEQK
ncbi:MAG: helix-turn-helix transcriptional regulator [Schwartzia sp.]|nr:helix-turn-helix transcriptional regulator [Schwartzia sp. (in: firmicutes)]